MYRLCLALGLALWLVLADVSCGGKDDASAPTTSTGSPTASASPATSSATTTAASPASASPASSPRPGATPAPNERALGIAADMPLPRDIALIYFQAPFGKDGGPIAIRRVYRTSIGQVRDEVLVDRVDFRGIVADSGVLAYGACEGDGCLVFGLGAPEKGTTTRFRRSLDGGASWDDVGVREGSWVAAGVFQGNVVALRSEDKQPRTVVLLPLGREIGALPAGATNLAFPWLGTTLGWQTQRGLVGSDGSALFTATIEAGTEISAMLPQSNGRVAVASIRVPRPVTAAALLSLFEPDGRLRGSYRFQGDMTPGAWFNGFASLVVDLGYGASATCPGGQPARNGSFLAIVNTFTGTLSFITDPPFTPGCRGGTDRALWVQEGPFLRVNAPGDCLNLRRTASTTGEVIACIGDRALVAVNGEPVEANGRRWAGLTLADGRVGYAAAEFLERQ